MVDLAAQVNGRFLLLTQRASGVTLGGEVTDVTNILNPTEVAEQQIPAVEAAIIDINAGLIVGQRRFLVLPGIADAVAKSLNVAGWAAEVQTGANLLTVVQVGGRYE